MPCGLLGGAYVSARGMPPEPANTVVVGSKNFTEQIILGRTARAADRSAHRRCASTGASTWAARFICQQALLAGQMDLYAEYTGTALTAILGSLPRNDPAAVYRAVRDAYRDRFDLEVGPPLGFNNTFAIVVRGEDAKRLNLRTISDMVPYAPQWRAGFGYEFMERSDGYRGLADAYGLEIRGRSRASWIWACSIARSRKSRWMWSPEIPPTG